MKKLLQLLFLFVISASSFSQSLTEKMTGILNKIDKNIPVDQLFLHLDRNLYHPGDTIRFQAYIRDRRTGVFETESSALYALLLNSNHVTIDSARFRIINSTASGWLRVPGTVQLGDYSILAFTSIDMNYSHEYVYTAPVKINDIIPARSETERKRKNETGRKSKSEENPSNQASNQQPAIDLRFLPEGGTFICGIQQRLAFNAVTTTGRGLEVTGVITNQRGETITEFRSTPYGPGVVEFTPLSGDSYFATLKGEEFKGLKWSLPSPEKSGVALRVNNVGNEFIDIILKGREIAGIPYFLTITMNTILIFSEDVRLDTSFRKLIKTDKLPSGTAFITLYDRELNPVAERLIFLNDYKKMNVEIGVSSPFVNRGDETELTVNTTDDNGNSISSVVSVAVIDSLSGYLYVIPLPEIESAFLYDKEFYNNLPFKIKSLGLKNMDSKSVDVLLMTYGWRKFTLKEVNQSIPEKELVNYDYLKIINTGPRKKGRSNIKLISIENLDSITLITDNNREAKLLFDSLDINVRQIMILPDDNPVKNINPIRIAFPENKDFTDKAKLLTTVPDYSIADLPVISKKQPGINLDSVIIFEPVTIKAEKPPPKVYVDKYAKVYQSAGARTMYSEDFISTSCFEDILTKVYPYYIDKDSHVVYLRGISYILGSTMNQETGKFTVNSGMRPALIVVDGTKIGMSYETIATMPASIIASVTSLRGIQGCAMFGKEALGGVVFVTTKMNARFTDENYTEDEVKRNDDLFKQVRLFRTETEFYIPTKEEVASVAKFQFRPTILWIGDVIIDESGQVKITYPNNLVKGTAMVIVNGISFTNLIGSNKYSYKVK